MVRSLALACRAQRLGAVTMNKGPSPACLNLIFPRVQRHPDSSEIENPSPGCGTPQKYPSLRRFSRNSVWGCHLVLGRLLFLLFLFWGHAGQCSGLTLGSVLKSHSHPTDWEMLRSNGVSSQQSRARGFGLLPDPGARTEALCLPVRPLPIPSTTRCGPQTQTFTSMCLSAHCKGISPL